jgi:hypothetical protein
VLPFMIPILTKDGVVSKKVAKALGSAMWMYDVTGGWRIGKLHRRISAERAAEHFPTTHLDKLSAGYVYFDAAADDARLVLTVASTAATCGAVRESLRCRRRHPRPRRAGQRHHGRRRLRRQVRPVPRVGALHRQRGRRLGRRGAPARRADATPTRSGRRRACTSRCRGTRSVSTSR